MLRRPDKPLRGRIAASPTTHFHPDPVIAESEERGAEDLPAPRVVILHSIHCHREDEQIRGLDVNTLPRSRPC